MVSLKDDVRRFCSIWDLPQNLIPIGPQSTPHIWTFLLNDFTQQRSDLVEEMVSHVIVPRWDENSVVWLQDEVIADVVDDNCLFYVASKQTEVLHKERPVLASVLSVQTVLDVVAHVDLVNNLVSILLQSGCEDHNLIVLGHSLDELDASRSHQEEAVILVLNQSKQVRAKLLNLPLRCGLASHQGQARVCRLLILTVQADPRKVERPLANS